MENITITEVTNIDGTITEWVLIDHGNDQFTSVLKSIYDQQQVEHLTEIVPADE